MITVITKPISKIYDFFKFFQIILLKIKKKSVPNQKYGGHYAVTRSIVDGLHKIGADFNYNPKKISKLGDVVYIPGGLQALKWAIKMKRKGVIKKLIVGPNIAVLPTDYSNIIKSKYIDLIIANSEQVKDVFIEIAPELTGHIDIWPAGVDINFWIPNKKQQIEKNVLIYYKNPIVKMFNECKKILENNGYKIEIIFPGQYSVNEYREALNRNLFLIHLTERETQGISLAESWAMNTPSIVWNPGCYHEVNGKNYYSSSAPYLTNKTGVFFANCIDFKDIINNSFDIKAFSPRDWVLENMSDEKCAEKLINIINKTNGKN